MALELRQELRLAQKLTLQLQQTIKLLQYNHYELVQEINRELSQNIMLEESDDSKGELYSNNDSQSVSEEIPLEEASFSQNSFTPAKNEEEAIPQRASRDDGIDWEGFLENYSLLSPLPSGFGLPDSERPSLEQTLPASETLSEHLIWQLRMDDLSDEEKQSALYLIGNLNESGYLPDPSIIEEAAKEANVAKETVEKVRLRIVRQYDPLGTCSINLKEALESQATTLFPKDELLIKIIRNHLPDVEHRRLDVISRALRINDDLLRIEIDKLRSLEPLPGRAFIGGSSAIHITPDVFIEKSGDNYIVRLNDDGLPKLRLSSYYRTVMKGTDNKEVKNLIRDNLNRAQLFLRGISQRQQTILRVVEKIVEKQRDFFDFGIVRLIPMVLNDIAEQVSMHPSTISRVTSGKYAQTPQGLFELKFFFSRGVPQANPEKPDISAEALHYMIKELLAATGSEKPMSDTEICEALKSRFDIEIQRRTLAKHRAEMGILSASRRGKL